MGFTPKVSYFPLFSHSHVESLIRPFGRWRICWCEYLHVWGGRWGWDGSKVMIPALSNCHGDRKLADIPAFSGGERG